MVGTLWWHLLKPSIDSSVIEGNSLVELLSVEELVIILNMEGSLCALQVGQLPFQLFIQFEW